MRYILIFVRSIAIGMAGIEIAVPIYWLVWSNNIVTRLDRDTEHIMAYVIAFATIFIFEKYFRVKEEE